MVKIVLVDDHQDTLENLSRKIPTEIQGTQIFAVGNCDAAYYFIQQHPDLKLLIVDLTIQNASKFTLKQGKDLLRQLKKDQLSIPTIIYTDHHDLETIFPIIDNYEPMGFVLKNNFGNEDLFHAIKKVLRGEPHYVHKVNMQLKVRTKFEYKIDSTDEKIINHLPHIEHNKDWESTNIGLSERAVRNRLERLRSDFAVDNNVQLLLKLQRLGFLNLE